MNPKPWSHSSLSDFENCPKSYYHKRILKDVRDDKNDAALWGDYVHIEFEKVLTGKKPELPIDLAGYQEYIAAVRDLSGTMKVECKYAINTLLEPCDFFDESVWCRAILDVLKIDGDTARVLDHKTGKRKPGSRQLKLSALLVFLHHPEVEEVHTAFFWLKEKAFDSETFKRSDMDEMWKSFVPSLEMYMTAHQTETFQPRQSGLCNGWCPVKSCQYWREKRR